MLTTRADSGGRIETGVTETATYLTPAELAELLRVSVKTVSRWQLQDSSMPVVRLGRVVRFPRADLLRWLARRSRNHSTVTQTADRPPHPLVEC